MAGVKTDSLYLVLLAAVLVSPTTAAAPSCPVTPTEGDFALRKAGTQSSVPQLTTMLATDAVVVMEAEPYELELWETDVPIDIKTPPRVSLPKGSLVGSRFFGGQTHRCVFWGLGAFEPPIDDEGRPFPSACFADLDNDGAFETVRLYAYKAQPGKGVIETKIAPIRLTSHPQPVAPKPYVTFYRRLKVVSVDGDVATFVVELGSASASPYAPAEPVFRQGSPIPVQLHEGSVRVGGIDLNVIQVGEKWSATPTGQAHSWVKLDCGNSKVTLTN